LAATPGLGNAWPRRTSSGTDAWAGSIGECEFLTVSFLAPLGGVYA